jgi:hypothetical protein
MNDYISYTVIATGFDSARGNNGVRTIADKKQSTTKLSDNFRGGFTFFDQENVDSKDLDVPTILRVNSPKASLEDDEEKNTPSGFNVDASRYSWAKEKAEQKNDSDDDESSSFLRMIMD